MFFAPFPCVLRLGGDGGDGCPRRQVEKGDCATTIEAEHGIIPRQSRQSRLPPRVCWVCLDRAQLNSELPPALSGDPVDGDQPTCLPSRRPNVNPTTSTGAPEEHLQPARRNTVCEGLCKRVRVRALCIRMYPPAIPVSCPRPVPRGQHELGGESRGRGARRNVWFRPVGDAMLCAVTSRSEPSPSPSASHRRDRAAYTACPRRGICLGGAAWSAWSRIPRREPPPT